MHDPVKPLPRKQRNELRLVFDKFARVHLSVLTKDEAQLAWGWVKVYAGSHGEGGMDIGPYQTASRDIRDGKIVLDVPASLVRIFIGSFREGWAVTWLDLNLVPNTETYQTVVLEHGRTIRGYVRTVDGKPVSEASVWCYVDIPPMAPMVREFTYSSSFSCQPWDTLGDDEDSRRKYLEWLKKESESSIPVSFSNSAIDYHAKSYVDGSFTFSSVPAGARVRLCAAIFSSLDEDPCEVEQEIPQGASEAVLSVPLSSESLPKTHK